MTCYKDLDQVIEPRCANMQAENSWHRLRTGAYEAGHCRLVAWAQIDHCQIRQAPALDAQCCVAHALGKQRSYLSTVPEARAGFSRNWRAYEAD